MPFRKFIFVFIIFSYLGMSKTIGESVNLKRLEPSGWWIGMKNPVLQLLAYGENIGLTSLKINIPGVQIQNTTKTENKNYLFITLIISDKAMPGNFIVEFIKDNTVVAQHDFRLLEREKNPSFHNGFDASDVIYLLMPDRFANGDPVHDSVPEMFEKANRSDTNGRHGGDIQGIINHLDYLQDLGITTLWSTPLLEDNMETYSYHTYAISDYYRIDPRFGTNQDYRRLSDGLHKRNMKLIMDVVTNHCGLNHWWMKDLPVSDWVHQFNEFTRTNYQISTNYDPYASEHDRLLNINGWFDKSMPDLNLDNDLLFTYVVQNCIWWIEYAALDGIRVDTYPYNNPEKMAMWAKAIREEYPNINIVGECWAHTAQEIAYWQEHSKNNGKYNSYLPAVMDFALQDVFSTAINEKDDWFGGIKKFYNHFSLDYIYANPRNLLIFTENHDTHRFNKLINGDIKKFKLAYTLLFTIRGIPQFYYGSEILMTGDKDKGDGDIRRDFPGGWAKDKRNAFIASDRTAQENEAFNFIRKLLQWRKSNSLIATGKTTQFVPHNNCYVYFRYNDDKTIMVVINNHDKERRLLDTMPFAERLQGFTSGYDIISEKRVDKLKLLDIPPKTSMIIELMR